MDALKHCRTRQCGPSWHSTRRRLGAWAAAALLLAHGGLARAQAEESVAERQVKAAFVYKFTGYVEWPAEVLGSAGAPFTIGVLGADALAAELALVATGRSVDAHPVTVRRLRGGEPLADVAMLFVGRGETPRLKALLAGAARPMLVVTESDAEGAMPAGSMINLLLVDRRVRFEVALDTAERAGVRLSSRLLAVAHKVHGAGGP